MSAHVIDYRLSTLVVLCKDCNKDVGLYPSRHKCGASEDNLRETGPTSSGVRRAETAHVSSDAGEKRSRFHHARSPSNTNRPDLEKTPSETSPPSSGRNLWGKVWQSDKWKQMVDKDETNGPNKLWDKLLQATQNMADRIPSRDDRGPESDESDWEGETHVSRILREHYEKKREPLPQWLRDNGDRDRKTRQETRYEIEEEDSSEEPVRSQTRKQRHLEQPSDEPDWARDRGREYLRADRRSPRLSPERDHVNLRMNTPPARPRRDQPISKVDPNIHPPTSTTRVYHDKPDHIRPRPSPTYKEIQRGGRYPGEYI